MDFDIGIIGGSGFYHFLDNENIEEMKIETPYGSPSDNIAIVQLGDKKIAFLPRHGKKHILPPHVINYRANLYAMSRLGVKSIIGLCAAGSLKTDIKPGDFVVCDQFVDRTWGRKDTFYDGPDVIHIRSADPYCPELRQLVIDRGKNLGLNIHGQATVVVIQGPRLSTRAESRWFSQMGWDVVNMTQYPENMLSRELGICYVNISLISDYDAGLEGYEGVTKTSYKEVIKVLKDNNKRLRTLLCAVIESLPGKKGCSCEKTWLKFAEKQ